jgi:hypothetical protein
MQKPLFALLLAGGLGLGACASQESYTLRPGVRSPAAVGEVNVKTTKNDNQSLTVKVDHLAMPSDLGPSLNTYVVWIAPGRDQPPMPVGQIEVSKDRSGQIQVLTPFKSFDVLVTAEPSATPPKPSPFVVLQGRVDVVGKG